MLDCWYQNSEPKESSHLSPGSDLNRPLETIMAIHAPITGAPTCAPFNPADWLSQFESLGGGYAATENSLQLAILLGDQTDAELIQARLLVAALTPDDKAAIFAHLKAAEA